MRNVTILFGTLVCLFGPTVLFTLIGYKSMETLAKRPTEGARVMMGLTAKLATTAVVLIAVLGMMLKSFGK